MKFKVDDLVIATWSATGETDIGPILRVDESDPQLPYRVRVDEFVDSELGGDGGVWFAEEELELVNENH